MLPCSSMCPAISRSSLLYRQASFSLHSCNGGKSPFITASISGSAWKGAIHPILSEASNSSNLQRTLVSAGTIGSRLTWQNPQFIIFPFMFFGTIHYVEVNAIWRLRPLVQQHVRPAPFDPIHHRTTTCKVMCHNKKRLAGKVTCINYPDHCSVEGLSNSSFCFGNWRVLNLDDQSIGCSSSPG